MPGPAKVKVVELMVEAFMASLNVAVTTVLGQTPVARFGGLRKSPWAERMPRYWL